jgi:hypothetical protein
MNYSDFFEECNVTLNIEEIEKSKLTEIELTKTILDPLSVNDIIYAEIAGGGAMGYAGQIMIYMIKEEQLVCYITSLFKDEETYNQADELLRRFQSVLPSNGKKDEILFIYYYGGMGNHVFVNKHDSLEIMGEHFVYKKNNKEYHIYTSVLGVFNYVAEVMQNPEMVDELFRNK